MQRKLPLKNWNLLISLSSSIIIIWYVFLLYIVIRKETEKEKSWEERMNWVTRVIFVADKTNYLGYTVAAVWKSFCFSCNYVFYIFSRIIL